MRTKRATRWSGRWRAAAAAVAATVLTASEGAGSFDAALADEASADRSGNDLEHGDKGHAGAKSSKAIYYSAPAGELPALREVEIDGYLAAVLPNGRLVTPVGVEVELDAPKPYGIAMTADGTTLATVNSGARPFSVSLIKGADTDSPSVQQIGINATFMGIVFAPDGERFYVAGGENGNIWVGNTAAEIIDGSVNLNGSDHAYSSPLDVLDGPVPAERFEGPSRATWP